jgi:hypothetical protein
MKSETWTHRLIYRNLSDHTRETDFSFVMSAICYHWKTKGNNWFLYFWLPGYAPVCWRSLIVIGTMRIGCQYHHTYFCIEESLNELNIWLRPVLSFICHFQNNIYSSYLNKRQFSVCQNHWQLVPRTGLRNPTPSESDWRFFFPVNDTVASTK